MKNNNIVKKIKISKSNWTTIGRQAGWIKMTATEDELQKSIGSKGLCPVCGEKVEIIGLTTNDRLIGTCRDAFTFEKWNEDPDDWKEERS